MKLTELISRVRRQIPSATVESVSDDIITSELNHGVDECNLLAEVYKSYTEITLTAEKQIYSLSEKVPNYLGIAKNGVWYFNSSGVSKYLFAKTIRWLDLYMRNWRDLTSGEPQWYWIDGDDLGFFRKPDQANKAWVYHLMKSTPMDSNDNYPWFNKTTESIFRPFDNAITAYAVWALSSSVGKENTKSALWQEFIMQLTKATQQVKRRRDLVSDYDYYLRIDGHKS